MSRPLTCPPHELAFFAYRSARAHLHVNLWNATWYARHVRQDIEKIEGWTVAVFRSRLSVAQGIVTQEWEVPGE